MQLLVIGLVVFIAIHLVPMIPTMRQSLIGKLGEAGYKSVFSIFSALGFVALLMGYGKSEYVQVFTAPDWAPTAAKLVMLPAFVLLVASYYPNNIKRWVKHPMLIATVLWSATHLLANGDQASAILFGGFLFYALLALISMSWRTGVAKKSTARKNDLIVVAAGVIVFAMVYAIHGAAFAPIP